MENVMRQSIIKTKSTGFISLNLIFVCGLFVWMTTPYLFRNIRPVVLIIIFAGWFITIVPSLLKIDCRMFLFPLLWMAFILLYKFLGISTATWGNYYVQFFFWLCVLIYLTIEKCYSPKAKRFLFCFIWLICFTNIVHNIYLLIVYPGASTYIYQEWGSQYLSMNVGDTSFSVLAVYFLLINYSVFFIYKKHFVLSSFGIISSIIYIFLSARAITFITVSLIFVGLLITRLAREKKRVSLTKFVLVSIIVAFLFFVCFQSFVRIMSSINPTSNVVLRLQEISNMIFKTDYQAVDSGEGRIGATITSLNTWTSSTKNFLFGVGFSGKDASSVSVSSYGIGQHSETIDNLARYGLVGEIIYLCALIVPLVTIFKKSKKRSLLFWAYVSIVVYSFLNSFTNSSSLGMILYIGLPLIEDVFDGRKTKIRSFNKFYN